MALKTQKTAQTAAAFVRNIADPIRQAECRTLTKMMKAAAGAPGKVWGTSIVGFGSYHYVYASGQEGDWPLIGFSPRKQALTLYIMAGFTGAPKLMKKLGKYKTGKSCLYLKRLEDVDLDVLRQLMDESIAQMLERHPAKGAKKAVKKKVAKTKPAKKKATKKKATKKKVAKRKPAKRAAKKKR